MSYGLNDIVESIEKVANGLEGKGLLREAEDLDIVANTIEKMAKKIPAGDDRPAAIFDDSNPKVNDGKDHYPIPDHAHAQSALQRLKQFWESKPSWWDGSLKELRDKIVSAVKSKFPKMKIDESKFKEAAELDENVLTAALSECESMLDVAEGYTVDACDIPESIAADQFSKEGAKKQRAGAIFQAGEANVNDGRDHFPITSRNQAKNALSRAGAYKAAPSWYNGTLSSLKKKIHSAVHAKYPGINISKE